VPYLKRKSNLLSWLAPKGKTTNLSSATSASKTDPQPVPAKVDPTSDFQEVFLPFRVKKGSTLAPINYFKSIIKEIIVLDHEDEDISMDPGKALHGIDLSISYRAILIMCRKRPA
jgi:hypothetical protein